MLLSLALLVLILGIVIAQSTHGVFSSLIMAMLTVCCAAAAFGLHEWLATALLAKYWKPDFALGISLGAAFAIPLVGLRLAFDRLIPRACPLPVWIDRAGAALCGFVTAEVMVGVLAICLQLLPFGESILGWSRFDLAVRSATDTPSSAPSAGERGLAMGLNPDRFTARMIDVLSSGVFSGSRRFGEDHGDYVQSIGWVTTARPELSRFARPNSIAIVSTAPVSSLFRVIAGDERRTTPDQYEELPTDAGKQLRMVRVKLKNEARDTRKSHAFSLRQFQLVGDVGGVRKQFHPVAIQQADAAQPVNRHVRLARDKRGELPVLDTPITPRDGDEVEIVFELPKDFNPSYLQYKLLARAKVQFGKDETLPAGTGESPKPATSAPPVQPASGTPPSTGGRSSRRGSGETVPTSGQGGRVRGLATLQGDSFFGDQLPLTLKAYQTRGDTDIGRNELRNGHLVGQLDQQEAGKDKPVEKFDVPTDKRLLHLHVSKLQARSALGRAVTQAVGVAQNFTVLDARGRQYSVAGKYAVARVGNEDVVEVEYFPEQGGMTGAMAPFQRIKESELKPDDHLVLLFLVDPGAQIVSFSTGGDASRADDLRGENLVAPK